jgi:LytS/YehU family sensor histidine kinase
MSDIKTIALAAPAITGVRNRTIATAIAVVAAVAFPQVIHLLGAVSGVGPGLAQALLPMHIPVILAGLLAGPTVGVIAGTASPLIAFAISGMPVAELLPYMVLELAAYGLVAGLLSTTRVTKGRPRVTFQVTFFKVVIVAIVGRLVRLGAIAFALTFLGVQGPPLISVWDATVAGAPGIILAWAAIPLIMFAVARRGYDK